MGTATEVLMRQAEAAARLDKVTTALRPFINDLHKEAGFLAYCHTLPEFERDVAALRSPAAHIKRDMTKRIRRARWEDTMSVRIEI